MEIVRFGVGHRRKDGPAGTSGVQGQVIHSDARGIVSELAFARKASMEPHSNPNTTWFIVIEGGGWVIVGDERERVAAGEAVLWPAGILHGAWTDFSEMRAFIVEFGDADDAAARGIIEGRARRELSAGDVAAAADGQLSKPPDLSRERTSAEGEPF
ncbi:MAG: cupin domain-containing protein [Chloroflexi bacterium]|nr:MAG: cupin domain-containing protein [Chloroflexota bacterium]